MLLLGIETSCDETAVAILRDHTILADFIASQDDLHMPFGGVVPELASRRHLEVLPTLLAAAQAEAGIAWSELNGIAVTRAPGLIGCLLVGVSMAKGLAATHNLPLIGVNHLEAHLQVAQLTRPIAYPFLGLVVSGGHTSLYLAENLGSYRLLGATRDDAAGEAYDKVAKLLDLGYPGGPVIDRLAADGNPKAFPLPRPKLRTSGSRFEVGAYDFSFSGIKTAVAHRQREGTLPSVADVAASFQYRVVEELVRRIVDAAVATGCRRVVVAGGVAANRGLRARLDAMANEHGLDMAIPPMRHCTDNAVMIAATGMQYLRKGIVSGMTMEAKAVEELSA